MPLNLQQQQQQQQQQRQQQQPPPPQIQFPNHLPNHPQRNSRNSASPQPHWTSPTQSPSSSAPLTTYGPDIFSRVFGGCLRGGGVGSVADGGAGGGIAGGGGRRNADAPANPSNHIGGGNSLPPPPPPGQQYDDPDACAGCGRGFGLFTRSWVTGMGRKWHAGCFKCLVCGARIRGAYRWSGFWRERYCAVHEEERLLRCCACSRLQKQGEEWAPLPDGRPLCLQCLYSVVLDTQDAQPLYDEVLSFYAREMRLPHAYRPPLYLVDGGALNSRSAQGEGRGDAPDAPRFHTLGRCCYSTQRHSLSIVPALLSDFTDTLRAMASELLNSPNAAEAAAEAVRDAPRRARCHVRMLLVLYGLPRLLCGSIMAHELMHAWLRMEGLVGLAVKVEEGLCELMACLWLDRQHERLRGWPEEQRLASYFSYKIRTDTSEVYGEGFREAMEAFQLVGITAVIHNVKLYGSFMPPRLPPSAGAGAAAAAPPPPQQQWAAGGCSPA